MNSTFIRIVHFLTMLLFLLTVITSCKKADELTQFNMEYNSYVVISSSTGINLPINLFTPDIQTNSESTFEVNDTRKDLVEQIILEEMVLSLEQPPNADFSFLESIRIYLSAQGLPEILIAWEEQVAPNASGNLDLNTNDENLKEYLTKEEFKLKLEIVTDELITSDHEVKVRSFFFVDAKILGV